MGFLRQEHRSGLPFTSPRDRLDPGIEAAAPALGGRFFATESPGKPLLSPWTVKVKAFSHVRLFVTPWTVAYQASPSMGFSRQVYWSGFPFPSPGDLPKPGTESRSPAL